MEISQKFVAFSEYMKFNCMHYILMISNCCWNKYNQSIFNKPFWRLFAIWFNSGNLTQWPETEILLICWNLHGICQTVAGISNQSIFWRVFANKPNSVWRRGVNGGGSSKCSSRAKGKKIFTPFHCMCALLSVERRTRLQAPARRPAAYGLRFSASKARR